MSTPPIYHPIYQLSDSELQELLKRSRDFLSAVDEMIHLIPYNASDSTKQKILRFLFMDARTAAYDICVLAESLLTNDSHHFSRAIGASRRLLIENTIDFFYISESNDSVAEQRMDFMHVTNTQNGKRKKKAEKAFKKKYKVSGRGDFWSGKSREEKIEQGIQKYPPIGDDKSFANTVKSILDYLNEQVHGNTIVILYLTFDKHGEYAYEYRGQVAAGIQHLLFFYYLVYAYCNFNGRESEIERFDFYYSYLCNLI